MKHKKIWGGKDLFNKILTLFIPCVPPIYHITLLPFLIFPNAEKKKQA